MTPERWKKLNLLFQEAVELQGEAREAHLARVCGDDGQLRIEAEQLLAAHEREGSFLDSPIFADAEAIADEDADFLVGRSIGPYKLIRELGRGGMGEVYLAHDARLGRKVAIKLLSAVFTNNAGLVQRFEQEARAASALNHPNILTIHEVGKASTDSGDAHYIVSEFVEGETLRSLMQNDRLDISQATAIASQVASALSVAHEAGIIHRDIKPENVMVRPDSLVKVLDFGLAKLMEQPTLTRGVDTQAPTIDLLSTTPGMILGTVKYMSPEQARGQKVDQRTDIFSLGVMLYEMVAGRRPFEGATTNDVIAALLTAEPPPLSSFAAQTPAELERIINKCLAKDREARCQSAKELMAELKPFGTDSQPEVAADRRRIAPTGARLLSRRWFLIAGVAALLIAGSAWFLYGWRRPAIQPVQIQSLAVLPLENLSGDAEQEYFADGMTDALIGDLAKIGALRVISRTSAMHYKKTKKSLPQIASELKVDVVVEGTVQRFGDQVRIRVQLINAATDAHLWVETYERDLRDVMALQSEVARTIAREIQTRITPAEQARLANRQPVNRKAFDGYLQARYHRNKGSEAELRTAVEHLQSAIRVDPNYAPAYAELARCYNMLSTVLISAQPPMELRRLAEEAARQALALDSGLVEARIELGYVKNYNWDWDGAGRDLKQAVELAPNNAEAHYSYARNLVANGRAQESISEIDYAQKLDPLSVDIGTYRGYALLCARRYDEAIGQFHSVLAMEPNYQRAYWHLGQAYAANRQFDEAIRTYEKLESLSGRTPSMLGFLGECYGLAGRKAEAGRILNELLELSRRRYVTPPAVASVYMGLGDHDGAFAWLEKAYQERSNYMVYLKVFPGADPLRSDPRLDDLLRRIGLTK